MIASPIVRAARVYRENRFACLLLALLLLIVSGPVIDLFATHIRPVAARVMVGVTVSLMLLAAVFAISRSRASLVLGIALAAPALFLEVSDVSLLNRYTHRSSHIYGMLFLLYVIVVILRYIFQSRRVTANTVFASLCVYLLMGVFWAMLYSLVEHLSPGSFSYGLLEEAPIRFGTDATPLAMYYSLVTMTTLGYGDIVPASEAARAFSTLQAVTGQLYLTVLVARLVGLHIAHSRLERS